MGRTQALHVVFDGPQRVVMGIRVGRNAAGTELHVGHVAAHEIEAKPLLTGPHFLANVVPGNLIGSAEIELPVAIVVQAMVEFVPRQRPEYPRKRLGLIETVLIPDLAEFVRHKIVGHDVQPPVGRGHGHGQRLEPLRREVPDQGQPTGKPPAVVAGEAEENQVPLLVGEERNLGGEEHTF